MSDIRICPKCNQQLKENSKFCQHCGHSLQETMVLNTYQLLNGTMLNNRYKIVKEIGDGNFGITYLAEDTKLQMNVAIKEFYLKGYVTRDSSISPEIQIQAGDKTDRVEKLRNDFINEARSLAKLAGLSGIVEVHDQFDENNTAYIVMEYLDGDELGAYIDKNGYTMPTDSQFQLGKRISMEETKRLIKPVILALQKVHDVGLVHRDISPDNMKFAKDGNLKIFDFGAAREADPMGETEKTVMLKIGYAPEEQHRKTGKMGPWTDVYALCATIYKCITGVIPDESIDRSYQDHLKKPSELGIIIDPLDEGALMMGLAVRAENRLQDMKALYKALYRDEDTRPNTFTNMSSGTIKYNDNFTRINTSNPTMMGTTYVPERKKKSKVGIIIAAGVVLFIGCIVGVVVIISKGKKGEVAKETNTTKIEAPTEIETASQNDSSTESNDTFDNIDITVVNNLLEQSREIPLPGDFGEVMRGVCEIVETNENIDDIRIQLNEITSNYFATVEEHYNLMYAFPKSPEGYAEIKLTCDKAMEYFNQLRNAGFEAVDYENVKSLYNNYLGDYKQGWADEFDRAAYDSMQTSSEHAVSRSVLWGSIQKVLNVDDFDINLNNSSDPLVIRYRLGLSLYVDSLTQSVSSNEASVIIKEYMKETNYNVLMVAMLAERAYDTNASVWLNGISSILDRYDVYNNANFVALNDLERRNYVFYLLSYPNALSEIENYMASNYCY